MPIIREEVVQTANDTSTELAVDTQISIDSRSGWRIRNAKFIWVDASAVATADLTCLATISTETGTFNEDDDECIAAARWQFVAHGTPANVVEMPTLREGVIDPERVTVSDELVLRVATGGTGQTNQIIFIIDYEVVKLSEIDMLRLRAVGA